MSRRLEEWVIRVLQDFGITGARARATHRHLGRDHREATTKKSPPSACACGAGSPITDCRSTFAPDLTHYQGIVPCGLPEFGVTSLQALGVRATMEEVDDAFRRHAAGSFAAISQ
jgi:lipoyl(octanoyl) transferase